MMKKLLFICILSLSFCMHAEETSDEYPVLHGIIISSHPTTDFPGKRCLGVCIKDIKLPGKEESLANTLKQYLNEEITEKLVGDIKDDILNFYRRNKHPLVVVRVPDQDITKGIVNFVVIETRVGKVKIKDNKWKKEKEIRKEIRLEPGEPISSDILNQDLYWLNRNPFREAYVIYTPGERMGTTDVEMHIKDRLPVRAYAGIDNIGTEITGYNRIFAGIIFDLWLDHLVSYQYTTGSTLHKFQSHALQYSIPFSWRHQLVLIGGYSYYDVDFTVDNNPEVFHQKGMSLQLSARYDIPFVFANTLGELSLGFDFKRTNNNLEFSELPVFGSYANLTQLMMGYTHGGSSNWYEWNGQIEGYWSPGRWVSDQSNENYNTIRAFAKNYYAYLRSASHINFYFPKDFEVDNYLRWQIATQNLLPSEMYGLGGYDTVRGYKERIYNGDHAIIYNFEIKSPAMSLFGKKDKGKFRLLAFFDMGSAWKNHKAPGEKGSEALFSVGPGFRYSWLPYLTARVDWGFQLRTGAIYGKSHQRGHFSVIVGF